MKRNNRTKIFADQFQIFRKKFWELLDKIRKRLSTKLQKLLSHLFNLQSNQSKEDKEETDQFLKNSNSSTNLWSEIILVFKFKRKSPPNYRFLLYEFLQHSKFQYFRWTNLTFWDQLDHLIIKCFKTLESWNLD